MLAIRMDIKEINHPEIIFKHTGVKSMKNENMVTDLVRAVIKF